MTQVIAVTSYGNRKIETICQDGKLLLRAFIGEVCYKTSNLDLHEFAKKLGWEA